MELMAVLFFCITAVNYFFLLYLRMFCIIKCIHEFVYMLHRNVDTDD